jgi:hypothetical protein
MVGVGGGHCFLRVRPREFVSGLGRFYIKALAGVDLHLPDPMLPEEVDIILMADETLMQEKWGSIPGLVHPNDEHSRFKLVDRDRLHVFHL